VLRVHEGSIDLQIISLRPEVIIDHVKQDADAFGVGGIDQGLEVFGLPVAAVGREQVAAVIAPVPTAWKIGDRHDLDRGNAQISQQIQLFYRRDERSFRGERADMQLVDDHLLPGATAPACVPPEIAAGIDDLAGSFDILGLEARSRVGDFLAVLEHKAVAHPCAGILHFDLVPTSHYRRHRDDAFEVVYLERDSV
jgi:hypothetical protein